jgi:ribonuclease HI
VTLLKPLDSYRNTEGWAIYTDGSGPTPPQEFAGWGIAIWSYPLDSALPDFELFGPVPLDKWDERWLGADVATNNVAEVTAMAEAFIWLDSEAPGPPNTPVTIHFDSTYAMLSQACPHRNTTLPSSTKQKNYTSE